MAITPTTWNPADSSGTLSAGNLVTTSDVSACSRSTFGASSGKWYWEYHCSDSQGIVGVGYATAATYAGGGYAYAGLGTDSWGFFGGNGNLQYAGADSIYGFSWGSGSRVGVALDMDAGTLEFFVDGVSQGIAVTGLTGTVYAMAGGGSWAATTVTANFGATAFYYSPPAGFTAGFGVAAAVTTSLQIKRGTRAQLDAAATAGGLKVGEPYLITDESRFAVGLTTSTYEVFAKSSEAGGGGGGATVAVSDTAPASPTAGALWVNTTDLSLNIWFDDGTSSQWAEVSGPTGSGTVMPSTPTVPNIGVPGAQGFGVGAYVGTLPSGFSAMPGADDPASANYGNYQFTDGSVMVFIPKFYYRIGHASSPRYAVYGANAIDIANVATYADEATANAAGYALHRAFYNAGTVRSGVFVDKYLCSNNAGVASSIALGNPMSVNSANNPISALIGTPANTVAGAVTAARTRGTGFFCTPLFVHRALALLSMAHAQASNGTTHNAWYDPTHNFPKGNNSNTLSDVNDPSLTFTSCGYLNFAKAGSANVLAKTTHNGQNSGVTDVNGNFWDAAPGLTFTAGTIYVLKTTTDMAAVTGGSALSTDLWGTTGIAAQYQAISTVVAFTGYGMSFTSAQRTMGSASQVFGGAVSGNEWHLTSLGIPKAVGGTNAFGNDVIYDGNVTDACSFVGGQCATLAAAGVWTLSVDNVSTVSYASIGFRASYYGA